MLSTVVTASLFFIMMLMVASCVVSVLRVQQQKHTARLSLPSSWYTRRRMLVSFAFLLMVVLTLFT